MGPLTKLILSDEECEIIQRCVGYPSSEKFMNRKEGVAITNEEISLIYHILQLGIHPITDIESFEVLKSKFEQLNMMVTA